MHEEYHSYSSCIEPFEKATSATFILGEESDFADMNEERRKWFPEDPPARQGAKLPIHPKGMKISIALIAEA